MLYLSVLVSLLIISVFYEIRSGKRGIGAHKLYYFYLVVFVLIAGLRWKVGGDTFTYQRLFDEEIPTIFNLGSYSFSENKPEPLFVLLISLCKTMFDKFWFFQIVHATIINVVIFRFIRKYTPYKFTALFFYFFSYYLYYNTEILRESLAICGFLLVYPYFYRCDWKRFYLASIPIIFFHYSAIIILLFPLVKGVRLNARGILILLTIILSFSFFKNLGLDIISSLSLSSSILSRYEMYSGIGYSVMGMVFLFVIFMVLPFLVYKFNSRNGVIREFEELVFIYFLLAAIYVSVSGFGRFINYLGPFMFVFLSNVIYGVSWNPKIRDVKGLIILILIIVPVAYKATYYVRSTDEYVNNTHAYNLWYPYSSVFTKEEYYYREVIYREGMRESYYNSLERE